MWLSAHSAPIASLGISASSIRPFGTPVNPVKAIDIKQNCLRELHKILWKPVMN